MARRASKGASDFPRTLEINPSPLSLGATYTKIADAISDFRPMWPRLAPKLGLGLQQNLLSKGASIGERWPRPNARYARRKMLAGFGETDFIRTGETARKLGEGRIVRMGRTFLSVGFEGKDAERVIGAHFGYPGGPPPRWFFGWSAKMKSAAEREMARHIEQAVAREAGRFRRSA